MVKANAVKEYKSGDHVEGYLLEYAGGKQEPVDVDSLARLIESRSIKVDNLVLTNKSDSPLRLRIDYTLTYNVTKNIRHGVDTFESLKFKVVPPENIESILLKIQMLGYECTKVSENPEAYMARKGLDVIVFLVADRGYIGEPIPTSSWSSLIVASPTDGVFQKIKSKIIDLRGLDFSRSTDLSGMFMNCFWTKKIILGDVDTSHVKDMSRMFFDCEELEELDITGLDTSNVENMQGMFKDCNSLKYLDFRNFDFSNVRNIKDMCVNCSQLEQVDIGEIDFRNCEIGGDIFFLCSKLKNRDELRNEFKIRGY